MKKLFFIPVIALLITLFSCTDPAPSATDSGIDTVISQKQSESKAEMNKEKDEKGEKNGVPLTVVCLGDSVTAGVFELKKTGTFFFGGYIYDEESAYPKRLEVMLREIYGYDAKVFNAGVSGDTVNMGQARLANDVFVHGPDIVTVCFGLNDVCMEDPELYASQLRSLFDEIINYDPEIKIVFITPNMLATYVNEAAKDDYVNYSMALGNVAVTESGMLDVYMETARQVCADYNIPVSDVYAYWKQLDGEGVDITELLASYVTHPSREMHQVFADMLIGTLVKHNIIG